MCLLPILLVMKLPAAVSICWTSPDSMARRQMLTSCKWFITNLGHRLLKVIGLGPLFLHDLLACSEHPCCLSCKVPAFIYSQYYLISSVSGPPSFSKTNAASQNDAKQPPCSRQLTYRSSSTADKRLLRKRACWAPPLRDIATAGQVRAKPRPLDPRF